MSQDKSSIDGGRTAGDYRNCDPKLRQRKLQYQDWMKCRRLRRRNPALVVSQIHSLYRRCEQSLQVLPLPWTFHPQWNGWILSLQDCLPVLLRLWRGFEHPKHGKSCPDYQWQKSGHWDAKLMQKSSPSDHASHGQSTARKRETNLLMICVFLGIKHEVRSNLSGLSIHQ